MINPIVYKYNKTKKSYMKEESKYDIVLIRHAQSVFN